MQHSLLGKGLLLPLLLFVASSCCIPYRADFDRVPEWVFSVPRSKDYLYAVGSASRGLSDSRMVSLARERALEKLAQAILLYFYVQTERKKSRYIKSEQTLELIQAQAKLHAIEEARWMDRYGVTGAEQLYILMKIPKRKLHP